METGEKVVSKVCLGPCWVQTEDGLWAGRSVPCSNGRDIFYDLSVNTQPPPPQWAPAVTGFYGRPQVFITSYFMTGPHWHLHFTRSALCLTNTELSLKHEQGRCRVWLRNGLTFNPNNSVNSPLTAGFKRSYGQGESMIDTCGIPLLFRNTHLIRNRHTFLRLCAIAL